MNSVNLIGNMTKDCELRRTSTGKAVANFTLAVSTGYGDTKETSFINCLVWNKQAENLEKYTSKGSKLGITGQLRQRTYENRYGQKVYVVEVLCTSIEYLKTNKQEEQSVASNNFYNSFPTNSFDDVQEDALNSFNIMDEDLQF